MKRWFVCVLWFGIFLFFQPVFGATFDLNTTPSTVVTTYDLYGSEWIGMDTTPDVAGAKTSNGGYFWGTTFSGADFLTTFQPGYYQLAKMDFTNGETTLTARGFAANSGFGYYTSAGAGWSQNVSTAANGTYSMPEASYAYAPSADGSFLVMYDSGTTGLTGNDTVDAYVTPAILFDSYVTVDSLSLANTNYTANILLNEDPNHFSNSMSYADDSYFGLTVTGTHSDGSTSSQSFLLADFLNYGSAADTLDNLTPHNLTYYSVRDAQTGLDTGDAKTVTYRSMANGVLNNWTSVDLSGLGEVNSLIFEMFSSDYGAWGFNTPFYFAVDNIVTHGQMPSVPEPSTWILLALACTGMGFWRCRRPKNG